MENIEECCICLEPHRLKKTKCNHPVCLGCNARLPSPKHCPICRVRMNKPLVWIKCACKGRYTESSRAKHFQSQSHCVNIAKLLYIAKRRYFNYTRLRIENQLHDIKVKRQQITETNEVNYFQHEIQYGEYDKETMGLIQTIVVPAGIIGYSYSKLPRFNTTPRVEHFYENYILQFNRLLIKE